MVSKLLFPALVLLISISQIQSQQQFTWSERTSPVSTSLNCVDGIGFTSPNWFWMCGNNGVVLKTRDYGATIINQTGNGVPTTVTLISVAVFDTGTVVTAGFRNDTAFAYRTTNGGSNWVLCFTQPGGYINAVVRRLENFQSITSVGFMAGNPVGGRWSLWRTNNSGASWDSTGRYLPRAGSESGYPGSLANVDSSVWIGTNNARVYRSLNNGASWTAQTVAGETGPSALLLRHGFNDYRGTFGGTQTKQSTFNSGQNWANEPYVLLGTGRISAMVGHDGGVFDNTYTDEWYLRNDNKVYHSMFGWQVQYTAPAGNFLDISQANEGTYFLAVRDNGGISYCACQIWGAVSNTGGIVPDEFILKQNYPNPFNPATTISFSLPKSSQVSIKIYNSIGAEMETIVNNELNRGNYEITWDASKYPSGIYYSRLEANGFSGTKKMILVK